MAVLDVGWGGPKGSQSPLQLSFYGSAQLADVVNAVAQPGLWVHLLQRERETSEIFQ